MLRYIHTENTSKAKRNESAFSKTSTPKALSSQKLIFHSMLPNKTKKTFSNGIRDLVLGNNLLSLGLKSNLLASILMLSTSLLPPQKTHLNILSLTI